MLAYRELRAALAGDVRDRVREQSPDFFEQVVLDVLQAMGYGGSREDAAERLGRSGDEGVDGLIRDDKLGLDLIYVQAKKWANTVGRPDIQRFVGALSGQRATKGVFITTSNFSRDDHNVGVSVATRYEIQRIDLDYFGVEDDGSGAPQASAQASRVERSTFHHPAASQSVR